MKAKKVHPKNLGEAESKTKRDFMIFDDLKIQKNSSLLSVFPEIRDTEIITYDSLFNKSLNVVKDVCALSNTEGGFLFIGVNVANRCVGSSYQTREAFLDHMLKLSRFIWTTTQTLESKKLKYSFKNFIVTIEGNSIESYLSQITIEKCPEKCVINSYNNISCYIRVQGETIPQAVCEEVLKRFIVKESPVEKDDHSVATLDIGDSFNGEENETMEFKQSFCFLKSKEGIGKYFSSFGNSDGGTLMVGICDEGKVVGVKIENQQEWDTIKCDILRLQHHINNVDFLSSIRIEKIALKRKNFFLVKIDIPKNTGPDPILVRDKLGVWNKWKRVLSCSVNDDRTLFYTKNEFVEMEKNYLFAQTRYEQVLREYELLKEKNEEVRIQIEKEKEESQQILHQQTQIFLKKYNFLKNQKMVFSTKSIFTLCGLFVYLGLKMPIY